jgi:hypothetical protein
LALATRCIARAANFAGLLALAGEFGTHLRACARPSHDDAWLFRVTQSGPAGSAKRFVAVTCAVSIPPYSRASATDFLLASRFDSRAEQVQPDWVARLPEHEVRGDGEGPKPANGC